MASTDSKAAVDSSKASAAAAAKKADEARKAADAADKQAKAAAATRKQVQQAQNAKTKAAQADKTKQADIPAKTQDKGAASAVGSAVANSPVTKAAAAELKAKDNAKKADTAADSAEQQAKVAQGASLAAQRAKQAEDQGRVGAGKDVQANAKLARSAADKADANADEAERQADGATAQAQQGQRVLDQLRDKGSVADKAAASNAQATRLQAAGGNGAKASTVASDPSVKSARESAARADANARDARTSSNQATQQAQDAKGKRVALEQQQRSQTSTIGAVADPSRDNRAARAAQAIATRQQLAQARADEQGATRRAVLADQAADQSEQKAQQTRQLAAQTQSARQAQLSGAASAENAKNPSAAASNDPRVLAAAANATADESGAWADQARAFSQGKNEGASPQRTPQLDAERSRAVEDAQRSAGQASERASQARSASDSAQRDLAQADSALREQRAMPQSAAAVKPSERGPIVSVGQAIAGSPLVRATVAQRNAQQRAVPADRAADLAEQQAGFAQGYAQQAQATQAAGGDPRVASAAAAASNDEAGVRAQQARVAAGLEAGAMPNLPALARATQTAAPANSAQPTASATQKPANAQTTPTGAAATTPSAGTTAGAQPKPAARGAQGAAPKPANAQAARQAQQQQQQQRQAALIQALQADPTVQSAQQSSAQAGASARDARAQSDASAKQADATRRTRVQLQAQVTAKGSAAPAATRQALVQAKVNEQNARQRAVLADRAADQSEQQAQLSQALSEQTVRQRAAELMGAGGADTARDPYAAVANDSRVSAVASQVAAEQAGLHADQAQAASLGLDPAAVRPKVSPQQSQGAVDLAKDASATSQANAKQARALSDDAQRQSQQATQARVQAQASMTAASKRGKSDPLAKQQYTKALAAEKQAQLRAKVADRGADIAEQQSRMSQALAQQAERGQAALAGGAAPTGSAAADWRAAVRNDPRVAAMGAVAAADASGQGMMLAQAATTAPYASLAKWPQQQAKIAPAQVAAVPATKQAKGATSLQPQGAAAIDAMTGGAVRDSTAMQMAQTPASLRDPATVKRLNEALAKGQPPSTVIAGARVEVKSVKVNGKAAFQAVLLVPNEQPRAAAGASLSTAAAPLTLPGQEQARYTSIALGQPVLASTLQRQQTVQQRQVGQQRGDIPQRQVVRTRLKNPAQVDRELRYLEGRRGQLQMIISRTDPARNPQIQKAWKASDAQDAETARESHRAYGGTTISATTQRELARSDRNAANARAGRNTGVERAKKDLVNVNQQIAYLRSLKSSKGYVTSQTTRLGIQARRTQASYDEVSNRSGLLDAQIRAGTAGNLATAFNQSKGQTIHIGTVDGVDQGTRRITPKMVFDQNRTWVGANSSANFVLRDTTAQNVRRPFELLIGDATDRSTLYKQDYALALNRGDVGGANVLAGKLNAQGTDLAAATKDYFDAVKKQGDAAGNVGDRYMPQSKATVLGDLRRGSVNEIAWLQTVPGGKGDPELQARLTDLRKNVAGLDGGIGIAQVQQQQTQQYYANWDAALAAQASSINQAPVAPKATAAAEPNSVLMPKAGSSAYDEPKNPIAGQSFESFPDLPSLLNAQPAVDPKTGKTIADTYTFTLGKNQVTDAGDAGDYRVTRQPDGQWKATHLYALRRDTNFVMSAQDSGLWQNAADRARQSDQLNTQATRYANTAAALQSAYSLVEAPAPSGKTTTLAVSQAQARERQLGQQLVQAQDKLIANPDDAAARTTVQDLSLQFGLAGIDVADARSAAKSAADLAHVDQGHGPRVGEAPLVFGQLNATPQSVQRNGIQKAAEYDQARIELQAGYGEISHDTAAERSAATRASTTDLVWRVDHPEYQTTATTRAAREAWVRQTLTENGKAPSQDQIDAVVDGITDDRNGNLAADGAPTVTATRVTVMTPDGKGTKDKVVFNVTQTDDPTSVPIDEAGASNAVAAAAATPGNTSTFVVSDGGKTFANQADYEKWYGTPNVSKLDAGLEASVGLVEAGTGFAFGWFGAPIIADGGLRAVHGFEQLVTGKQSDPYLAQGLQAAGVKRDVALRTDTGVGLVLGLAGGGKFVFELGAKGVKGLIPARSATTLEEAASAPGAATTVGKAAVPPSPWVSSGRVAAAGGNSYLLGEQAVTQGGYVVTGEQRAPWSIQALMKTGMSETTANYVELFGGVAGGLGANALGNKINARRAPTQVLEGRVLPREPVANAQPAIEAGGPTLIYEQLADGTWAWTGTRTRDPSPAGELVPEIQGDGSTVWRNPQLDSLRRLDTQDAQAGAMPLTGSARPNDFAPTVRSPEVPAKAAAALPASADNGQAAGSPGGIRRLFGGRSNRAQPTSGPFPAGAVTRQPAGKLLILEAEGWTAPPGADPAAFAQAYGGYIDKDGRLQREPGTTFDSSAEGWLEMGAALHLGPNETFDAAVSRGAGVWTPPPGVDTVHWAQAVGGVIGSDGKLRRAASPESVQGWLEAGAVPRTGLGDGFDAVMANSPQFRSQLATLHDAGWRIEIGAPGSGGFTRVAKQRSRLIVVDSNYLAHPETLSKVLAHEMGHALHEMQWRARRRSELVLDAAQQGLVPELGADGIFIPTERANFLNDIRDGLDANSSDPASVDAYHLRLVRHEGAADLNEVRIRRDLEANGVVHSMVVEPGMPHASAEVAFDRVRDPGDPMTLADAENAVGLQHYLYYEQSADGKRYLAKFFQGQTTPPIPPSSPIEGGGFSFDAPTQASAHPQASAPRPMRFRVETRSPQDVRAADGFHPKPEGALPSDPVGKVMANTPGRYISTSESLKAAQQFARDESAELRRQGGGYVYLLDPARPQVRVSDAFAREQRPLPEKFGVEREILVDGAVPWSRVAGWRPLDTQGNFTGGFVRNPDFVPRFEGSGAPQRAQAQQARAERDAALARSIDVDRHPVGTRLDLREQGWTAPRDDQGRPLTGAALSQWADTHGATVRADGSLARPRRELRAAPESQTTMQAWLDDGAVPRTGLGDEFDMLMARSPTHVQGLVELHNRGWTIQIGDAGRPGSFIGPDGKTIVLDRSALNDPAHAAGILEHEIGHALLDRRGEEQALTGYKLADEANATLRAVRVRSELAKDGPAIRVPGSEAIADAAYNADLLMRSTAEGSDERKLEMNKLALQFGVGERTSTSGERYEDYYLGHSPEPQAPAAPQTPGAAPPDPAPNQPTPQPRIGRLEPADSKRARRGKSVTAQEIDRALQRSAAVSRGDKRVHEVTRRLRAAGTPEAHAAVNMLRTGELEVRHLVGDPLGSQPGFFISEAGRTQLVVPRSWLDQPDKLAGALTHEAVHRARRGQFDPRSTDLELQALRAQGAVDAQHPSNRIASDDKLAQRLGLSRRRLAATTATGVGSAAALSTGGYLAFTQLGIPPTWGLLAVTGGAFSRAFVTNWRYTNAQSWDKRFATLSDEKTVAGKIDFEKAMTALVDAADQAHQAQGRGLPIRRANKREFDRLAEKVQSHETIRLSSYGDYTRLNGARLRKLDTYAELVGVDAATRQRLIGELRSNLRAKSVFDQTLRPYTRLGQMLEREYSAKHFFSGLPEETRTKISDAVQALNKDVGDLKNRLPDDDAAPLADLKDRIAELKSLGADMRPASSLVRWMIDGGQAVTYGAGMGYYAGFHPNGWVSATGALVLANAIDQVRIGGGRTDDLVRWLLSKGGASPEARTGVDQHGLNKKVLPFLVDGITATGAMALALNGHAELWRNVISWGYAGGTAGQWVDNLRREYNDPKDLDPARQDEARSRMLTVKRLGQGAAMVALIGAGIEAYQELEKEQSIGGPSGPTPAPTSTPTATSTPGPTPSATPSATLSPQAPEPTTPPPPPAVPRGEPEFVVARPGRDTGTLWGIAAHHLDTILSPAEQTRLRRLGGELAVERAAARRLSESNGFDARLMDGRIDPTRTDPDGLPVGWKVNVNVLGR